MIPLLGRSVYGMLKTYDTPVKNDSVMLG